MATSFITRFLTPLLLVLSLYTASCSALKCFGCYQIESTTADENIPKCDRPIIVSHPGQHPFLGAMTTTFRYAIAKSEKLEMTKGPFCMEILAKDESGTPFVFRDMIADSPKAKFLDESGCITVDGDQACFCKKSRCNMSNYVYYYGALK